MEAVKTADLGNYVQEPIAVLIVTVPQMMTYCDYLWNYYSARQDEKLIFLFLIFIIFPGRFTPKRIIFWSLVTQYL